MKLLKTAIALKFKSLSLVTLTLIFSSILLMIRIKLNKSYFYLFLIWNIFLALIPYIITIYLITKPKLSKTILLFWFFIWLLFLPNAPYIVTDLIHIRVGNNFMIWLDILVILSFALTGLFLFFLSILDMQKLINSKLNKLPVKSLTLIVIFLCSFGVYLGRFLRYNSWEIISQPKHLFLDIMYIIIKPYQNYEAWLFIFGFGSFLIIGYWLVKYMYLTNTK